MFSDYEETFDSERPHFKQCQKCAMYFDAYNLAEVMYHEFDHAQDHEASDDRTVCAFCGHNRFEARYQRGAFLGFECEQCGLGMSSEKQNAA